MAEQHPTGALGSKVTILTIAEEARVSPATVSRVMNETQTVSPPLRRRVEAALSKHDYQPNPMARALKGHKTLTIGVIVSDFCNPFFTAVVRGLEDTALEAEHSVILCNSDENPEREHRYMGLLRAQRIDGIILSPTDGAHPEVYRRLGDTPIVLIDREVPGLQADMVRVDNFRGAHEAVSYLISLGHTKIATIAGPQDTTTGVERLRGYRNALDDAGIPIIAERVVRGNFRQDSGYDLVRQLLQLRIRPTAIFVANNLMTLGAMLALTEARVEIPRDMSIVGFDEVDWAQLSRPPLTVVTQPAYEVGADSAELLLRRIREGNDRKAQTLLLRPKLVIRDSTAPPRKGS